MMMFRDAVGRRVLVFRVSRYLAPLPKVILIVMIIVTNFNDCIVHLIVLIIKVGASKNVKGGGF